ncbi:hypothetical protein IAQ61_011234 [Plenodomus lingam]|uniref:uncharacterized protein n=1 Tax=Leptosphaeria maculans TaxID=5022 RepID=UPI00332E64C0|nr:hypothetical protein IAQ61_011234 [Plenodomus lingam]
MLKWMQGQQRYHQQEICLRHLDSGKLVLGTLGGLLLEGVWAVHGIMVHGSGHVWVVSKSISCQTPDGYGMAVACVCNLNNV